MESLKKAYLGLPPALRRRVPVALELWVYDRLLARARGRPRELETKLWGGFSRSALAELAALADGPPRPAAEAALILAGWHGARGEFEAALAHVVRMREIVPSMARDRRQVMLEALFLCRLGRGPEARARLAADATRDVSGALMRANSWSPAASGGPADEAERLAGLNAVFRRFGLVPLAPRDPGAPLSLDNLRGEGAPARGARGGPRVTVIVPLYNGAATILTALRSLAEQAWEALEVLVVDDASQDAGPDIVADFAKGDPRFRLIRQGTNQGGYAARNRALALATGEFVTAHDADDWSHPEKIATQMRALGRGPYNFSAWVRTGPDLFFWGPSRPSRNLVGLNHSSALMRTELVRRLGGWDAARVAADTELVWRIERALGNPQGGFRARRVLAEVPLAFGRLDPASLTRSSATHILTNLHGLRREYLEAAALWHQDSVPRLTPGARLEATPPFFPAPPVLRPERSAGPAHDLLFVGDFNFAGGTFHSAMHMLRAARGAGLSAALLQYRRYDQNVTLALKPEVRREAATREVRIIAPGEAVRAKTVVVTYPVPLAHVMDRFPRVAHEHLVVVVNQMAERDLARSDVAYDPAAVRANLEELFGGEGLWAPISERVRALMAADPRYPAPHAETWTPLIDLETWCAHVPRWRGTNSEATPRWRATNSEAIPRWRGADAKAPPRWRGAERRRPVLGRHGRDHPLKWPRDPAALAAAYCAGRPCELRFLGGARHARARLRRWPRNWRELAFDAVDVRGFLAGLDVFLHFPDPDYIEEFGRAPMEAMAVGVPVILPPEFAPTFGPAALYAAPDAVWPLVERLWGDRAFWEARVAAGRAFVRATCGYDAFHGRLARLAARDPRMDDRLAALGAEGMASGIDAGFDVDAFIDATPDRADESKAGSRR